MAVAANVDDSGAGLVWRKSTRSGGGANECVEVAVGIDRVRVRDSKDPNGGQLDLSRQAWGHFIDAIKQGAFDRTP